MEAWLVLFGPAVRIAGTLGETARGTGAKSIWGRSGRSEIAFGDGVGVGVEVFDAESREVLGPFFELLGAVWDFLRLVFVGSIASAGAAS